ncbi:MAG: N-acetylglucosamine-6-phosphate deacetylase [Clostridia bacterium]|nr:N-acetylglucosamine-6-phosphate deacetylase [Clostridia bacterium]
MKYILIKNGLVIGDKIEKKDILLKDGIIENTDFKGEVPENCSVIDASGLYVLPGFIDIHLHGGGGYDFMDCTETAFETISRTHLQKGTTTMLPTTVSAPFTDVLKLLQTYKKYASQCPNFYGVHLEGPFISVNQRGAHKAHLLHAPEQWETDMLIEQGRGIIKRITAAPELAGMDYFCKRMIENGVWLSVGHSDATCETALSAFNMGFSHITHLYSATPSIRKIGQEVKAGVIEAAYLDDRVSVELIADGKHVAKEAIALALKIKGVDKVAFVTDALCPAGTDVTESFLGEKMPENRIIIEDGVAKLPDRSSFAGSIVTADMLLERAVNYYGISLPVAVKMLTKTPAKILGIHNKGEIKKGYDADMVLLDKNFMVQQVLLKGETIL